MSNDTKRAILIIVIVTILCEATFWGYSIFINPAAPGQLVQIIDEFMRHFGVV
jgi:hypothetical protein